jgi:hypothetical protein
MTKFHLFKWRAHGAFPFLNFFFVRTPQKFRTKPKKTTHNNKNGEFLEKSFSEQARTGRRPKVRMEGEDQIKQNFAEGI